MHNGLSFSHQSRETEHNVTVVSSNQTHCLHLDNDVTMKVVYYSGVSVLRYCVCVHAYLSGDLQAGATNVGIVNILGSYF